MLTFYTIAPHPGDTRCYVRVLPASGGYDEMGYFASPERARWIACLLYKFWAWELSSREFDARMAAREVVACG